MKLPFLSSPARLALLVTFGGLLLILIFAHTVAAQTQTFNPTYEMSSEGNIQTFTVSHGGYEPDHNGQRLGRRWYIGWQRSYDESHVCRYTWRITQDSGGGQRPQQYKQC
jgi:hypothetical protein